MFKIKSLLFSLTLVSGLAITGTAASAETCTLSENAVVTQDLIRETVNCFEGEIDKAETELRENRQLLELGTLREELNQIEKKLSDISDEGLTNYEKWTIAAGFLGVFVSVWAVFYQVNKQRKENFLKWRADFKQNIAEEVLKPVIVGQRVPVFEETDPKQTPPLKSNVEQYVLELWRKRARAIYLIYKDDIKHNHLVDCELFNLEMTGVDVEKLDFEIKESLKLTALFTKPSKEICEKANAKAYEHGKDILCISFPLIHRIKRSIPRYAKKG